MEGLLLLALQAASLSSLLEHNHVQFAVYMLSQEQTTSRATPRVPVGSEGAPHCEISETHEIKITCMYTATPRSPKRGKDEQRIVLNRAELAFGTIRDSYMVVDLTFTNEGASPISGPHTAYLAVDNDAGQNMVRRVLPKMDLSKLSPGVPVTFSERFLIGGFRAGRYRISLLIPNTDPSLKDDPGRNVLLSNEGVADPVTGSNTIAHFRVGP
jgi:hypothetical protein